MCAAKNNILCDIVQFAFFEDVQCVTQMDISRVLKQISVSKNISE